MKKIAVLAAALTLTPLTLAGAQVPVCCCCILYLSIHMNLHGLWVCGGVCLRDVDLG